MSSATVPYQYLSIESTLDPYFVWPDTPSKAKNTLFSVCRQLRFPEGDNPPSTERSVFFLLAGAVK